MKEIFWKLEKGLFVMRLDTYSLVSLGYPLDMVQWATGRLKVWVVSLKPLQCIHEQ